MFCLILMLQVRFLIVGCEMNLNIEVELEFMIKLQH